ncbi:hypothetical protein C2G38_2196388 [Gigaspora rosea]|uniref:Uncharacterized protein n=1 Tax=Gigaspora rosea TaxID=44941 RepID=A0A397UYZ0_9GLOM|nr:hypothetical protein C2G38_2196388 [Gigaspora rosea]
MSSLILKRLKLSSILKVDEETSILELEALKSFCPNITYLGLGYIEFSTQLIEVIDNIDETKEELEVRVIHFAEILSLTLQYLKLLGDLSLN